MKIELDKTIVEQILTEGKDQFLLGSRHMSDYSRLRIICYLLNEMAENAKRNNSPLERGLRNGLADLLKLAVAMRGHSFRYLGFGP
jgi:hypothetical protein